MRFARLTLLALVLVAMALPTKADEITDQIMQAIELYKAGDYAGAAGDLEFAAAQIRQMRAGEISAALPEALAGWVAQDTETASMGASYMGGATSANRSYTKDEASIDVNILTDSPMLSSLSMLLNNPMLLSTSGQKLIRVEGNKGALDWDGDSGDLNVVVNGNVLVSLSASNCTKDDLMAYAEAVDYALIKKLMSQ